MHYTNGFFQLLHKQDGTYLKVFPPIDNGEEIILDEVVDYLNKKGILEENIKELHHFLVTTSEPSEFKINSLQSLPQNEYLSISINKNNDLAVGRFYPPSSKGRFMTKEEIISELVDAGIKYGAIEKNIDNYLNNRHFCTDILLAKATPPVEGKDAVIHYHFKIQNSAKPKINEDGSVDFHQLDIMNHVNKEDVLATLVPADYGTPGMDVCGNPIRPKKVAKKVLKHGKNIHLSEDGTIMYADVSGHVTVAEDRVFVSDTYEVAADVDASTGDIEYDGNVNVRGNVRTGFRICAKGNIQVDGVVEGAVLEAGGQIVLKRGIQGMNRGILKAQGSILAKFIENSEVTSEGDITTDAIMHSIVTAKGDITVSGKRGLITGGEVRSGNLISMKTCGSKMGTYTLLEVGIDPSLMVAFQELEKELASYKKEKDKIMQILSLMQKKLKQGDTISEENKKNLRVVSQNNQLLDVKIKEAEEKKDLLRKEMESYQGGKIRVEGIIYSGVKIVINNIVYYIRNEEQHCQYIRDKADIQSIPL